MTPRFAGLLVAGIMLLAGSFVVDLVGGAKPTTVMPVPTSGFLFTIVDGAAETEGLPELQYAMDQGEQLLLIPGGPKRSFTGIWICRQVVEHCIRAQPITTGRIAYLLETGTPLEVSNSGSSVGIRTDVLFSVVR